MSIGPILSFDKSFIESLNKDESFWLDNLFITNIIPVFYIETLADLEKTNKKGKIPRSSEDIVKEIVEKTPIIGSVPNVHHRDLLISSLLGKEVQMDEHHRPIITGGLYTISPHGEVNVNFKEFSEAQRLKRWEEGKFLDVERDVAVEWKNSIEKINLDPLIELVSKEIPENINFSRVEEIKVFVDQFIQSKYNQFIYFALDILDIPEKFSLPIRKRWSNTRYLPFNEFAPYAAYVLSIDLLFYISLKRGFLSTSHKNKNTNIIDLSYLYYLPFSLVFVSSDSFHLRLANLFMDNNQMFIDGRDLKADLKNLVHYYLSKKDDIEKYGSMKYATYPPYDMDTLVGKIFDKNFNSWRRNAKSHMQNLGKPIRRDAKLAKELKHEDAVEYKGPSVPTDNLKSMTLTRVIPVKKGNWRILPKGIEKRQQS